MIQKPPFHFRDLFIVALVTSIFFGVFSALPMLLAGHVSLVSPPPPGPGPGMGPPPSKHLTTSILATTLMMLILWVVNILIYGRFRNLKLKENTRNIARYVLSYIAMFFLFVLYFIVLRNVGPDPRFGRALFFPLIAGITNNTIVLVILDLVVLQRLKSQIELENSQLKMNSIMAQHQHLKHQLQPHFLFNSLNTLKSLIKRQPLEAEDYLLRLSEFLRASLTSNTQDIVALQDELKLCVDYLEMQKVRFKDAFNYYIEIPEKLKDAAFLPVFSLQLLVENAIKHNGFTSDEPLHIYIRHNSDGFISVVNNKKPKQLHEPSSGIGLRNLSERYQVLAGKGVMVSDSEEYFSVELPILNK
ncbi:sensor histidine kinase [Pontibacter harenae]|uniref:sensor histidine kinase n=1 Tax=Pontibacter harenae TaxID=2894083 RepID=UPI001E2D385C|nr:histidine kinase [Pontibacter harenae]MCC9166649.1 histidine kinase [Pontibacter harenae]